MPNELLKKSQDLPFIKALDEFYVKHHGDEAKESVVKDYLLFMKSRAGQPWIQKISDLKIAEKSSDITMDLSKLNLPDTEAQTVVFVNGFYDQELSTLDEKHFEDFKIIKRFGKEDSPLGYLNEVLQKESISVQLSGEMNFRIIMIDNGKNKMNFPRLNLKVSKESTIQIEEIYLSNSENKIHLNLNLQIEDHAKITHTLYINSDENNGASHSILLGKESDYTLKIEGHTFKDFYLAQAIDIDEKAQANLNAVFPKYEKITWMSSINHIGSASYSMVQARAVGAEGSYAKIESNTFARDGVVEIDINQSLKGLYLGDQATFELTPNMLITGEKSEGHHGATMENLSDKALFYLRARGIEKAESQKILIEAFTTI